MRTFIANKENTAVSKKRWFLVDADGQILGRMAVKIAKVLRGKHKPTYTPHFDVGDHVVVVNAGKVRVTGRKLKQKEYITFSGYPGGQKRTTLEVMLKTKPTEVIKEAVRRMLPRNTLSRQMMKKLKVFAGEDHAYKKVRFEKLVKS